jgi:hypothetical protein
VEFEITNPNHKYFGQTGTVKFFEVEIDGVLVTHLRPADGALIIGDVAYKSLDQIDRAVAKSLDKC